MHVRNLKHASGSMVPVGEKVEGLIIMARTPTDICMRMVPVLILIYILGSTFFGILHEGTLEGIVP